MTEEQKQENIELPPIPNPDPVLVKRKRLLQAGVAAILVLLMFLAGLWCWLSVNGPESLDAQVEGQIYSLTVDLDGVVNKVLIEQNKVVQAGNPLILLDDSSFKARVAEEQAKLKELQVGLSAVTAGAKRQTNPAEESIRARMQVARDQEIAAQRDIEQLSVDHARMQLEARRLAAMTGANTPSLTTLNKARLAEVTAREALEAAQNKFNQISRNRALVDTELSRYRTELAALARMPANVREERLKMQENRLLEAQQELSAATIIAPMSGIVSQISITPGSSVSRGQIVAVISPKDSDQLWITAHFKSEHIKKMKVGDPCIVIFPDNFEISATITTLGEETEEENNEPVSVRIAFNNYNPESMPPILPGMKAIVRLGRF